MKSSDLIAHGAAYAGLNVLSHEIFLFSLFKKTFTYGNVSSCRPFQNGARELQTLFVKPHEKLYKQTVQSSSRFRKAICSSHAALGNAINTAAKRFNEICENSKT